MSTIGSNVLDTVNQSSSANSVSKAKASEDLRTNFMTLLTTQLQNQDPTKPLENAELTSQLAQINTVSGIEELNTTMTGITGQINTGNYLQATQMIGQGVMVPGDRVLVGKGVATPFGVDLSKAAGEVTVSIKNSLGEVVRKYELGPMAAGVQNFQWDGKLEDGTVAADGAYTASFTASTAGVPQNVTGLAYGLVSGVSKSADGTVLLDLGGTMGQVKFSDIRSTI